MKNIPKRPEPLRKETPYCWKAETRTGRGHKGITWGTRNAVYLNPGGNMSIRIHKIS